MYRYPFIATLLIAAAFPLPANVLLPGDSNKVPDVFPNPGSIPLLDSTTGTYSFGSGVGLITGTYTEAVLVDPFGVTCAGCLDFGFQIDLDPGLSAGIFSLTWSRFAGYATDVGYVDMSSLDLGPISVNRGPFGGGVGFVFVSPAGSSHVIPPGGSSPVLVIATNARTYDAQGSVMVSGGGNGSPANGQINGLFEPTAIPEPGTALLLSGGLVGVLVVFKSIRRK